ncbi:FISUMP domain-containing protein [Bacteroidota bacterium]
MKQFLSKSCFILPFLFLHFGFTAIAQQRGTVTDIEGNVYQTILIGNQWWMAENLRTTHYADSTALIDGTGAGSIDGDYITKYYFAYGDNENNVDSYGRLYTWAAAMNGATSSNTYPSGVQGVCPDCWHVPSEVEWLELINVQGGKAISGSNLKDIGFIAQGAGQRVDNGNYNLAPDLDKYWTTTEGGWQPTDVKYCILTRIEPIVDWSSHPKNAGHSVRCVKDLETSARFIEQKDQMKIYPNPSKGNLFIELPCNIETNVLIYTIAGKQIFSQKINQISNTLNFDKLQKGLYLLKIYSDKYVKTEKLVIE